MLQHYKSLYKTIQQYVKLYDTIQCYKKLYNTIEGYMKLYNVVQDYTTEERKKERKIYYAHDMYCLQHERQCCIGYTNSSRRREFVYPIQHGRECCKRLKKRLIL